MSPRPPGDRRGASADLANAARFHRAGNLDAAASACEAALARDPDNIDALHFLGVIRAKLGKPGAAVVLLHRAAALAPRSAEIHLNLGNALRDAGEPRPAIDALRRAIELAPELLAARLGLAGALAEAGIYREAAIVYRGVLLRAPDHRATRVNLGRVLDVLGDLDDAAECFRGALNAKPDDTATLALLAALEERRLNFGEAFWLWRGAARQSPDHDLYWRGMARALRELRFEKGDLDLEADLLQLLARPAIDPDDIAPAAASYLRARARDAPDEDMLASPLLARLLTATIIADPEIESRLIAARRQALARIVDGRPSPHSIAFLAALAHQCFATEYIYGESNDETANVDALTRRILAAPADAGEDQIAVLAAYRPLHAIDGGATLAKPGWSSDIAALIDEQIVAHRAEALISREIVALTPIAGEVTEKVRAQYEENPYPRWRRPDWSGAPASLAGELRRLFPHAPTPDPRLAGSIDVLVAGCGTGRHSCATALRFAGARILAVDLSRASLAYAIGKARQLNIAEIVHAQADLLALDRLGRSFDMIEAGGVLHHLADPLAGWRVLERLLRPGGYMRVALYSARARAPIIAARQFIAARGFPPTQDGIRHARAALLAEADESIAARLRHNPDFYAMSGCRDLLFHVHEHCLTLPQIGEMLDSLRLRIVGFEFANPAAPSRYRARFPDDPAMANLDNWHRLEAEHPTTFAAMYQFWVAKPAA